MGGFNRGGTSARHETPQNGASRRARRVPTPPSYYDTPRVARADYVMLGGGSRGAAEFPIHNWITERHGRKRKGRARSPALAQFFEFFRE